MTESNNAAQVAVERRAAALAEVTKMQQDIILAHDEIASLKRDLDRTEDRVVLLSEERTRYRQESTLYRTKLIELATSMANIGLLTMQAQEIMQTVKEIGEGETPEQARAEQESAAAMVAALPQSAETAGLPNFLAPEPKTQ